MSAKLGILGTAEFHWHLPRAHHRQATRANDLNHHGPIARGTKTTCRRWALGFLPLHKNHTSGIQEPPRSPRHNSHGLAPLTVVSQDTFGRAMDNNECEILRIDILNGPLNGLMETELGISKTTVSESRSPLDESTATCQAGSHQDKTTADLPCNRLGGKWRQEAYDKYADNPPVQAKICCSFRRQPYTW